MRSEFECGCIIETTPFGEVKHLKCLDVRCWVRKEISRIVDEVTTYRVAELPALSLDELRTRHSLVELGRFGDKTVVGIQREAGNLDLGTVTHNASGPIRS